MADRTAPRERLVAKLSSLTDAEVAELLDYVTIMESLRTQADSPRQFEEELIALLTEPEDVARARVGVDADRPRRRSAFVSTNQTSYVS
jgi:hypothetical protein